MKAAIFDIDGTLIDSVDLHARAWQEAFEHFGREFPFEKIRSQIGKGGDQLLPVFWSTEEIEAKGKDLEAFRGRLFKEKFLPLVKPFPHVRDLFQRLLADGWRLALASSAKKEELSSYKEIAQITDLLKAEVSSNDAAKSKPHPDIFQAAMSELEGVSPADCVVVGDSPYDASAAGEARIRSIGFLCGGFGRETLLEAGVEALYESPADLLAKYGESIFGREAPARA